VRYRGTTFFWHTERPGDGPSEGDSPGESRVSAPVDVVPGTADARAQARADVLGWNRLVVVNDPAGHAVYVSRQTPMQYPQGRTPPGAPTPNLGELYAASLTNGFGLGPATPDPGEVQGVNYPQYRYTLTFQQRRYFVRTDAQMLAQAPPAGSGLTPSPLAPGNATYQVTLGTPTAGTFTLTAAGNTTAPLLWSSSAAAVQAALSALPGMAGNVSVTGNPGGPYTVVFGGGLAQQAVTLTGASGLTGGTFTVNQVGLPGPAYPDEGDALKRRGWAFSRFVERDILPGGHYITVPSGFCKFTSDNQLLKQSMFWNESQANVTYRWRLVPVEAIPYAAIFGLMGSVDPEPFDFASTGGTLMFVSCGLRTYPAPSRTWLADLDYHFLYLPRTNRAGENLGVNAALRVTSPGGVAGPVDYESVVSAGDGVTPPVRNAQRGKPCDFASLFRPSQL
jgi:hypothetical protein